MTGSRLLVVLSFKNPVGSGLLVRGSSSKRPLRSVASSEGRVRKRVCKVNMAAIYRFAGEMRCIVFMKQRVRSKGHKCTIV